MDNEVFSYLIQMLQIRKMFKLCIRMGKLLKCMVENVLYVIPCLLPSSVPFSIVIHLLFFNYRRKRNKCATTEEFRGAPKEPNNIQAEQNESFHNCSALPGKSPAKMDKSAQREADYSSNSEIVEKTNTKSQSKLYSKGYFDKMKWQISYSYVIIYLFILPVFILFGGIYLDIDCSAFFIASFLVTSN